MITWSSSSYLHCYHVITLLSCSIYSMKKNWKGTVIFFKKKGYLESPHAPTTLSVCHDTLSLATRWSQIKWGYMRNLMVYTYKVRKSYRWKVARIYCSWQGDSRPVNGWSIIDADQTSWPVSWQNTTQHNTRGMPTYRFISRIWLG